MRVIYTSQTNDRLRIYGGTPLVGLPVSSYFQPYKTERPTFTVPVGSEHSLNKIPPSREQRRNTIN